MGKVGVAAVGVGMEVHAHVVVAFFPLAIRAA